MDEQVFEARVNQAKSGDKEALLALVLAAQDDYYRLALAYMRNRHDALDAMEEMIVTLYELIGTLREPASFPAWSKTILVNGCKRMLRRRAKIAFTPWPPDESREEARMAGAAATGSSDEFAAAERRIDLDASLQRLNEAQREAIVLKYVHDLDTRTIARMTNVPVGTVKSRIFHGLKRLKNVLGGDAE